MNRGARTCRYGSSCWNPSCTFDHAPTTAAPPSNVCRYGSGCLRQDCKYFHPTQTSSQYAPPVNTQQQQICRFGASCFAQGCRYIHPQQLSDSHDDAPEFTPEEEEFMDEILDMIEQEQLAREGGAQDSDDERNINEILDFIEQQPPSSQTVFESEFLLPEEAEREYKAMIAQERYQSDADTMLAGLNRMNIKGMSASAQPFVPRSPAS